MKIINELQKEYEKYVEINKEPYSKCVIDCGEIFGNAIDEGKTFEEAERIMLDSETSAGITGFMMGALISAVSHFHPRGEEVKIWWNKKCGGEGNEKGTINPALITLRD